MRTASSLPTCSVLWVGPPSKVDDIKTAQDVGGILSLKELKNPLNFYCLKAHEEHYKALFKEEKATHIQVISIEDLIKSLESSENLFFKEHFKEIENIIHTHLKRGTIRDFVTIKDFISLIVIFNGGYSLDSNIRAINSKSFSLKGSSVFMAPILHATSDSKSILESWMLYAQKNDENVIKSLNFFINHWPLVEALYQSGAINQWSDGLSQLIIDAIGKGVTSERREDPLYPWQFLYAGDFIYMPDLNLVKQYQGTHKSPEQNARIIISCVFRKDFSVANRKKLTLPDFKECFNLAVQQEEDSTKEYLLNRFKTISSPILFLLVKDACNKASTVNHEFSKLLAEQKMQLDAKDYHLLVKDLFHWALKCNSITYVKFLFSSLTKEDLEDPLLKEAIVKNQFHIYKSTNQIIKSTSFTPPVTPQSEKESPTLQTTGSPLPQALKQDPTQWGPDSGVMLKPILSPGLMGETPSRTTISPLPQDIKLESNEDFGPESNAIMKSFSNPTSMHEAKTPVKEAHASSARVEQVHTGQSQEREEKSALSSSSSGQDSIVRQSRIIVPIIQEAPTLNLSENSLYTKRREHNKEDEKSDVTPKIKK